MRNIGFPVAVAALATVLTLFGAPVSWAQDEGGQDRGDRGDRADRGDRGDRGGPGGFQRGGDRGDRGDRGGDRGGRGGDRGFGGGDPARIVGFILQRQKEALNASDEEWAVLSPLVEKVVTIQIGNRFSGRSGGGFGGSPGRGPGGGSAGSSETRELRDALENESTSNGEIKSKLDKLRSVRKKRENEFQEARNELRQVLTLRQEATLVLMGTLD